MPNSFGRCLAGSFFDSAAVTAAATTSFDLKAIVFSRASEVDFYKTMRRSVFVTGGTGYMGSRLVRLLAQRGHQVKALVRQESAKKLPSGVACVTGDALKDGSYTEQVRGADTFVHLIGVPHPSPAKAKEFREIDFVSAQVAVRAARDAGIRHFVYLSVAHPAPVMHAFIEVRSECEAMIRASGMPATFLRPWYVLGPGHRWPYALIPIYWLLERLSATKQSAQRLGLIHLTQMINALIWSVENPADGIRILDVPEMRNLVAGAR
jgi:uncharacterized protein YbjT (DUF2867 family)